jgi:hypothetical protein
MARDSQRKTQRTEVAEVSSSAPRIAEHTRYINARGNRNGVAAARALQDAFAVGQRIAQDEMIKRNDEGVDRAIAARATGEERDAADDNFGYNKAWDQLDAEYDFNAIQKELPELLRGFNAEERSEAEVQQFITSYFQEQFGGLENLTDSEYAKALAPALLELETNLIAEHRDQQIAAVQEEQRTKIFANAEADFQKTGELDYQKLFDQTGTFFEGADKKVVLWESIYEIAVQNGRPDLIENVPPQINGIPTGIDDPLKQAEHQQHIAAATNVAGNKLEAEEAALEAANENRVANIQMLIVDKMFAGQDATEELYQLSRLLPEAGGPTFSEYKSVEAFINGTEDRNERNSPSESAVAHLWNGIYTGEAGLSDIFDARVNGYLGSGNTANALMKSMMAAVPADSSGSGGGAFSPAAQAGAYRTSLNDRYNPQRQGPMGPLDGTLSVIRNEAITEYNNLLQEGVEPRLAFEQVSEKFDVSVDRLKPESLSDTGSQSQSATAQSLGLTINPQRAKAFGAGEMSLEEFTSGRSIYEVVLQLQNTEGLSPEDLDAIAKRFPSN